MAEDVRNEQGWPTWRIRLTSVLLSLALANLFALVIALAGSARSTPSGKDAPTNRYFRYGDPIPLAFRTVDTKTDFDELERNPHGGDPFEVGLEWRPEAGPFYDVKTEPSDETQGMCIQYHVRPEILSEFRASLREAFAGQSREDGPEPGVETWPDVRGIRLALGDDGLYTIYPLSEEDVMTLQSTGLLRWSSITLVAFCVLYWIVSSGLGGRFGRS